MLKVSSISKYCLLSTDISNIIDCFEAACFQTLVPLALVIDSLDSFVDDEAIFV